MHCNAEFWIAGSTKKIGPEEAERSPKMTREEIIKSAHEAVRKATATLEKIDEKGLEDEEKNLEKDADTTMEEEKKRKGEEA